jgi:hypothetical protein
LSAVVRRDLINNAEAGVVQQRFELRSHPGVNVAGGGNRKRERKASLVGLELFGPLTGQRSG